MLPSRVLTASRDHAYSRLVEHVASHFERHFTTGASAWKTSPADASPRDFLGEACAHAPGKMLARHRAHSELQQLQR